MKKYIVNVDIIIEATDEVTAHDKVNDLIAEGFKVESLKADYKINYTDED